MIKKNLSLKEYWKMLMPEKKRDFSSALGLSYQSCSRLCNSNSVAIGIMRCQKIEFLTEGAVRCEDINPQFNWPLIRKYGGES